MRCSATGVPLRGDRVAVGYPRYRSALLGAGRGLRWLLVRVPLLRTICGHSAKTGAARAVVCGATVATGSGIGEKAERILHTHYHKRECYK